MTQRRPKATSAMAAPAVLGLGLLTGCGGNEAAPQDAAPASSGIRNGDDHAVQPHRPGADRGRTEAQLSSPTKTQTPLSRFEDRPVVKALRVFAAVSGRAVNANNMNYKPWLALMTPYARKTRAYYIKEDLGLKYPGPLPSRRPPSTSTAPWPPSRRACGSRAAGPQPHDGQAGAREADRPRHVLPAQVSSDLAVRCDDSHPLVVLGGQRPGPGFLMGPGRLTTVALSARPRGVVCPLRRRLLRLVPWRQEGALPIERTC